MSTPFMALYGWCKGMLLSFWILWAFTLVVSRALIFHESYLHEQGKMQDEVYLLERCKDSEFYSNIRQHTDICTQVLENSRSSVLLKALNTMALNTHMCGLSPCMDFVQGIATRIGWQFFIGLGLLMLVFPNIAFAVYRLSRGIPDRPRHYGQGSMMMTRYPSSDAPFYDDYKHAGIRRRQAKGQLSV